MIFDLFPQEHGSVFLLTLWQGLQLLKAYVAGENAEHIRFNATLPVVVWAALELGSENVFMPTMQVSLYIPDTQDIEFAPQPVCPPLRTCLTRADQPVVIFLRRERVHGVRTAGQRSAIRPGNSCTGLWLFIETSPQLYVVMFQ